VDVHPLKPVIRPNKDVLQLVDKNYLKQRKNENRGILEASSR
jgi:hypothetical protein